MRAAKVPDPAIKVLLDLGYDTQVSFSFKDEAVFSGFAKDLLLNGLKSAGVNDRNWEHQPLVQKLRSLWKKVGGGSEPETALALANSPGQQLACPQFSPLLGLGSKSLTVADHDVLKRQLEKKYTGCVVELESLPAMGLLNAVKWQHDNKAWDWLPGKKVLSEKLASSIKERRHPATGLEVMLGYVGEEMRDNDLTNQPYPILQLLQVRANAYAMVGSGHLGSWGLYSSRFMKYYTAEPGQHFRFCTAKEAQEADQHALREVFALCFSGVSLDDALHTVAVDKDMLRFFADAPTEG